mgnify:FL=1
MLTYVETLRILTLDRQKVRPLIDKVSHSCNGFFAIFLCLFCCPLLCNDFDHLLVYNALISLHWLSTKFHHLLALPSYILHSTCYPFQHKKVLVAHPIHILKRCRIHATTGGSFRKVGGFYNDDNDDNADDDEEGKRRRFARPQILLPSSSSSCITILVIFILLPQNMQTELK